MEGIQCGNKTIVNLTKRVEIERHPAVTIFWVSFLELVYLQYIYVYVCVYIYIYSIKCISV
jgi:hypothetical protein